MALSLDALDIRLAYPPDKVRPLQVFDYALASALDPESPPESDLGHGLLSYSAKLPATLAAA